MRNGFLDQLTELQQVHKGLTEITKTDNETIVFGSLPFEASADGCVSITECFDIELIIQNDYPKLLPRVRETSGKIDSNYEHIYPDGTLCLAVPIEERRLFLEQPSLLGFVNRLLIPYFYGYCYWDQYREHPFDESEHGDKGIVQHYVDKLGLTDEVFVLAVICFLYEYGYRGHHPCPCGSRIKVRNCHGEKLRELNECHSEITIKTEFISILSYFLEIYKKNKATLPNNLQLQVSRILKNIKH